MGYFQQTQFVSNSELGELQKALNLEKQIKGLEKIYAFGSLLDAHLTEPEAVKFYEPLVDATDQERVLLMKQAGEADESLGLWLAASTKQHEIYRNRFRVTWNGYSIELPVRLKLDFLKKSIKTGADLKSTACTKAENFKDQLLHFNYDRQAAFYMDGAGLDRFLFLGISKKANRRGMHQVFKYAVERGDPFYKSGLAKYSFLATKHYFYIHKFAV